MDGQTFLSKRVAGIPMGVILVGVAALGAYFLFFRKGSSSQQAPSTGASQTGPVTIKSGPTAITVTQPKKPRHKTPNPQPSHKPHRKRTTHTVKVPNTVGAGGAVSFQ